LKQRGSGERCEYGYITPLPKAPRTSGFLVEEDDDMDEAFLREVDAICEEHARSAASKEKKAAEGDRERVGGSVLASTLINDARTEVATVRFVLVWSLEIGSGILDAHFISEFRAI
jgi:hypothetical protein